VPNGLRIERNGWDDGEEPPVAPPRPARPSVAATIVQMATGSGRATAVESLCASILEPLRADGRARAAWMGVTMGSATVVFEAGGPSKDAAAASKAAQALERSGEGRPCVLPSDASAALPGAKPGESASGVALPSADPWRGWIVVASSLAGDDARDVETLVAAAGGFAGLALARLAAVDRSRVAEARLAPPASPGAPAAAGASALAIATVDPGADAAPAPPAPNGVAAHGPARNGAPPRAAAPGPASNGAAGSARTLLSAAALDGIRSFVDATPGCKSPKLSDGPSVHVGVGPREAARWIARLLVAAAEGLRTLRVAVEADKPVLRIESDGPLGSRAGRTLASVGEEMGARGGSLVVEEATARARILATFPLA
jgi:hypothetical protein